MPVGYYYPTNNPTFPENPTPPCTEECECENMGGSGGPGGGPGGGGGGGPAGGGPGCGAGRSCNFSSNPVRYANGELRLEQTDLMSYGYGSPWGHVRTYGNRMTADYDGPNGSNWFVSGFPYLVQAGPNTLAVMGDANEVLWFDRTAGTYVGRFGIKQSLQHDTTSHVFRLIAVDGSVTEFHDFQQTTYSQGLFKRLITAGGQITAVVSYYGGEIQEVQRTSLNGSGQAVTESLYYTYGYYGRLESIVLRLKVDSGNWQLKQRVQYQYDSYNYVLLSQVTTFDYVNHQWITTGNTHYRYDSGSYPSYRSRLKFVIGPEAYRRMQQAGLNPTYAGDTQLAQYADYHFSYDSQNRVIREAVKGGAETYEFQYQESSHPPGANSWKYRTIETLQDGSQNLVYTNAAGQVMLKVFSAGSGSSSEGGQEWYEFKKYDADQQVILEASSAAISGYGEQYPDLLHEVEGQYEFLHDHAGLIRTYSYYKFPANQGTASYLKRISLQQGQLGTPIPQQELTYTACELEELDFGSGSSGGTISHTPVYRVAQEILWPDEHDLNRTIVTSYTYTTFPDSCQVREKVTTLPVIPAAQNGSGIAAVRREVFNEHDQRIWQMDERGILTRFRYDVATGSLIEQIQDVDTTQVDDAPAGWNTPAGAGLHLISHYEHDFRGRVTRQLGPAHTIDIEGTPTLIRRATWTVYLDNAQGHEVRTAQGYLDVVAGTETLINPVSITKTNLRGHLLEQIQAVRGTWNAGSSGSSGIEEETAVSSPGRLTLADQFPQESYTRWTTYQYSDCCYLNSMRAYHNIPWTGPGTVGTHYAQTSYDYDTMRRRNRVQSPGGTITFQVYDARGQVIATYIGTNDTGALEDDPTGGGYHPDNNMVIVSEYEYDDQLPGGNGNLTREIQHVNDTETRQTLYLYDWRNRKIATDGELDYFQKVEFDNLGRSIRIEQFETNETGHLQARSQILYDDHGQVYRTIQYGVDPHTGQLQGGTLEDNSYYDSAGNLLKTEPSDIELSREFTYDSLNRLIVETDPRGAETIFNYNVHHQRIALTDAEGNTTTWSYDPLDRVVKETNELDDYRLFSYTPSGELARKTDRNGRVTEYEYDALGRKTGERWLKEAEMVNTITYTYHIESQLLSGTDLASSVEYAYDGLGRLATASNAGTTGVPEVMLSLTYNRLNERTELTAQAGSIPDFANAYQYDKLRRMAQITQTSQPGGSSLSDKRIALTFNGLGQQAGVTRHESLTSANLVAATVLTYDPFGRLVGQSHTKDAVTLGSYSVTYDTDRRIDSLTTPDGLSEFDYDSSGQLLTAYHNYQQDEVFTYDLTGNRTLTGYSTGLNNQLLAAGDLEFEYDAEGNRLQQINTSTGETIKYTWDHRNRLTQVAFFDSTETKTKEIFYSYDIHNRRIRKQLDANGNGLIDSAQSFIYDAGVKAGLEDILLIFDQTGHLEHRFLHGLGIDQPLADEQSTGVTWLLAGQLGTITDVVKYNKITDTTINTNHLTYTSFGQITSQTDSNQEPYYTYTAREWDGEVGLYYYRARWYDAHSGRFINEDPIGFEGRDCNLKRYSRNSVIIFSDPSGMLLGWGYGNYCGFSRKASCPPGSGLRPIDSLDAACERHDCCVGATVLKGCLNWVPCALILCTEAILAREKCSSDHPGDPAKIRKCKNAAHEVAALFCLHGGIIYVPPEYDNSGIRPGTPKW